MSYFESLTLKKCFGTQVSALVQTRLPRNRYLAQRTNKAARSWRAARKTLAPAIRTLVRTGLLKAPRDDVPVPEKPSRLRAYAKKFKGDCFL